MSKYQMFSIIFFYALGDMRNQAADVNTKSIELKTGIENVQNDMSSVSEISQVILGSMDEMAAGSEHINEAAQSVSELALNTKENINNVNDLLKMFKI